MVSKKKKRNRNIFLGILLVGLIVGVFLFSTQQVMFEQKVYKAFYGRICCEEGAYEPTFTRYIDDYSLYICNAYTDQCEISIHPGEKLGFAARSFYFQICDINGKNCGDKDYVRFGAFSPPTETEEVVLDYGKSIKFSPTPFPNEDDWKYFVFDAKHRKFFIEGVENGRVFTQDSCILNPELRSRVLSDGLNELSKTGINRCQNYITDYVEVATNTYFYEGEEVICQARILYSIDTQRLLDDSSRKIQGDKLENVACCPSEPNCDENTFTFKENVIKECDFDNQCANAGEPISETGTTTIEYACINNKCVKQSPITRECTNDAICVDKFNEPSKICRNFECVDSESFIGYCGDGACESVLGETFSSCPKDCEETLQCAWYQEEFTNVDKDYGFLFFRAYTPFFEPKTTEFQDCKTADWVYLIMFGVIILILGLVIVNRLVPKKKGGKNRK